MDQKGAKMGGTRFFPLLSLGYFINRPKMQFKYAKLRRSYDSFPRNWLKCPFWAKKGIFGPGFFGQNLKMSYFRRIRKPQLCAKFQKIPMNGF